MMLLKEKINLKQKLNMEKSNDFNELKKFMDNSIIFDVHDWNSRREYAKDKFTLECISKLDSSGYINTRIPIWHEEF